MNGGYDSIYLELIPRLGDCDFHQSDDRPELRCVTEGIHLAFVSSGQRNFFDLPAKMMLISFQARFRACN